MSSIDYEPPGGTPPPPGLLHPLRQPASRTDRLRDALRQAILDGALPPGRALVERELAELYGVWKTPVREALKQLQSTGLVEINAYQGVSVRRPDDKLVRELYTARCAVEPDAVWLAAGQRGAVAYPRGWAAAASINGTMPGYGSPGERT
ncbi:GntR family transcriptional regulator [Streptomyces sp. NPDC006460]|uniref:GntR family transcriptional regulator n=1 Tax=Streptomyces sp. NPDC006460 TaxID=3154304 RepID=UPI0033AD5328